ncbi:hypothetical protein [Streptomyces syringium]|uniref:hypothetical protein n=1 Tax=Streptomyces syringium TaxID=76729 RepID=UPI0033EC2C28
MSAPLQVRAATDVIIATMVASTGSDPAREMAQALDHAGLLLSPETAEELARLRRFAAVTVRRRDGVEALLASVARDDARGWDLGASIIAILDGLVPLADEPDPVAVTRALRHRLDRGAQS